MGQKSNWFNTLLILVLLGLVIWLVVKSNNPVDTKETSSNTEVRLLYVQNAEDGTLEEQSDGNYKLTLNNTSPQTIFFADKPSRISGQLNTTDFTNDNIFKDTDNPPNAALEIMDAKDEEDVIIMELSNPVYDYTSKTMTYNAKITSNTQSELLNTFEERVDDFIPKSFEAAALFIDSGTLGDQCDPQGVVRCKAGKCDDPLDECVLYKGIYQCLEDVPY